MSEVQIYYTVQGEGGWTRDGMAWREDTYSFSREGSTTLTLREETYNGEARIAAEVRRLVHRFQYLVQITVSPHSPAWVGEAELERAPKGLTSILACDRKGAREIWYRVTTPEHRATIYLRG